MKYKTSDVFGVKSKLVASYIERIDVDHKFNEAIQDGNEIIVYGSSKQGKTSLILKHLSPDNYVKVECSPLTTPIDIYKSIIRQLNITFLESEVNENSTESHGKATLGFKIKIPFFSDVDADGELGNKAGIKSTQVSGYTEYNLALPQDISELLIKFNIHKYIVLENFHYLPL